MFTFQREALSKMKSGKSISRALFTFVFLALMASGATLLLSSPMEANAAGGSKTVGRSACVSVAGGATVTFAGVC